MVNEIHILLHCLLHSNSMHTERGCNPEHAAAAMGRCVKIWLVLAVATVTLLSASLYSRQILVLGRDRTAGEDFSDGAAKLRRYHRLDKTAGLPLKGQNDLGETQVGQKLGAKMDCQSGSCSNQGRKDGGNTHGNSATMKTTLAPSYKTETLTRLGTDLKFDKQSCPPESIMTNSTLTNLFPLHSNCPTLFIVGARKAGTTSLIQYLSKHPDFEGARLDRGPQAGETYFFHKKFETKSWEEYLTYFPSGSGVMTGESSVGNFVHCLVPGRIYRYCGRRAKVVVLLRNPVDRFVSNFQMRARIGGYGMGKLSQPIGKFIKNELDDFFSTATGKKHRNISTLQVKDVRRGWASLRCKFLPAENMFYEGIYYVHLENWLCNFPAENIMILNSEEFFQKTTKILKQVSQFLGLSSLPEESYKTIATAVYNQGSYRNIPPHQRLTKGHRSNLRMAYNPFNEALFELLDWRNMRWT